MIIVDKTISLDELKKMAGKMFGNRTRSVENKEIRKKIEKIVSKRVSA
jgi:hypothetical protein